jgi:hypothetical protein
MVVCAVDCVSCGVLWSSVVWCGVMRPALWSPPSLPSPTHFIHLSIRPIS